MKKALTISLIICVITAISPLKLRAYEFPFQNGEKLVYIAHYKLGFSSDLATLTLTTESVDLEAGDGMHVKADIRTNKFGDAFYRIRDIYETTFLLNDKLQPISYHRDVQEGKYWSKNWYEWDADCSVITMKVRKSTHKDRDEQRDNSEYLRDIINTICSLRSVDFDKLLKGERVKYPMIVDKQINDITVRVIGREEKKISSEMGTFDTIKLGISVVLRRDENYEQTATKVAIDSEDETIFMWVTSDGNHLPLYFTAPIALGSMNGRLIYCEGLKYQLEGKIK